MLSTIRLAKLIIFLVFSFHNSVIAQQIHPAQETNELLSLTYPEASNVEREHLALALSFREHFLRRNFSELQELYRPYSTRLGTPIEFLSDESNFGSIGREVIWDHFMSATIPIIQVRLQGTVIGFYNPYSSVWIYSKWSDKGIIEKTCLLDAEGIRQRTNTVYDPSTTKEPLMSAHHRAIAEIDVNNFRMLGGKNELETYCDETISPAIENSLANQLQVSRPFLEGNAHSDMGEALLEAFQRSDFSKVDKFLANTSPAQALLKLNNQYSSESLTLLNALADTPDVYERYQFFGGIKGAGTLPDLVLRVGVPNRPGSMAFVGVTEVVQVGVVSYQIEWVDWLNLVTAIPNSQK